MFDLFPFFKAAPSKQRLGIKYTLGTRNFTRWHAYEGKTMVAQSTVTGYRTKAQAYEAARRVIDRRFDLFEIIEDAD